MTLKFSLVLCLLACSFSGGVLAQKRKAPLLLHEKRRSITDLEIGGDLPGAAAGTTRYIAYDDLLRLPQVTYTISDDTNFGGRKTRITGIPLAELARVLGATPAADMVIAICGDQYRSNYPRSYMAAHHPLLVLKVNGKSPAGWPKDTESGSYMGPYLISHPTFTPSFKIFAHEDEAQIPWGVVRIELRNEQKVFGAIRPRGVHASDPLVQKGYAIARQNCFRCHNMGAEGGTKAGYPWLVLASWAETSPQRFENYVRDPQAVDPRSNMPGNPKYDAATVNALRVYFSTLIPGGM
jgi:mono/diheme cytochrome c family protein